jgi:peptide deformylase
MLEVIKYPNKVLREVCKDVNNVDQDLIDLVNHMCFTLDAMDGLGLAAPQVGRSLNVFIMMHSGKDFPVACVNPKIIASSEDTKPYKEGCLSIPGFRAIIHRPAEIMFEYTDLQGNLIKSTLTGTDAVVAQHEYDHLQGILFVDKLPRILNQNFIGKYGYDKWKTKSSQSS